MFGNFSIRYKIAFVWLITFICLWVTFKTIFPLDTMNNLLYEIENSIQKNDWEQANLYTAEFVDMFNKKKFIVQMNNSTEAYTNFEHTIGQLEYAVRYNSDSSVEYLGALKATLNLTVKPFAGP